jgi:hypothetical protein
MHLSKRRARTQTKLLDHVVGAGESVGGTSRPSALAGLRLIDRTYFTGVCTGRSAGLLAL